VEIRIEATKPRQTSRGAQPDARLPTRKRRAGCLARAARIVAGLLVALVGLGLAGALYESAARERELSRVAAPGQLVDVGGHRLHIVCLGEKTAGQPTVILESGVGGWSIHWHAVQRQAAQFARVCAYDRAGYGWSEAGSPPRDGRRVAAELHALLARSGEPGPYLLVGASRGGQYIRLYQTAYPEQVAGLVLVDAEPEDFRAQSALGQNAHAQNRAIFSVMGALSRVGVFRLLGDDPASTPEMPCLPWMVKALPSEAHAAYLAVEGQPRCFDALLREEAATEQREAQLRQAGRLGDLPLVVLARGIPAGATEQAAQAEQVWQALQQGLARRSSRGTLIQATRSGHNIALDQPELVIDAIRRAMREAGAAG
jgi:pimeloyl-ACP methyl ester carboxylesterase